MERAHAKRIADAIFDYVDGTRPRGMVKDDLVDTIMMAARPPEVTIFHDALGDIKKLTVPPGEVKWFDGMVSDLTIDSDGRITLPLTAEKSVD